MKTYCGFLLLCFSLFGAAHGDVVKCYCVGGGVKNLKNKVIRDSSQLFMEVDLSRRFIRNRSIISNGLGGNSTTRVFKIMDFSHPEIVMTMGKYTDTEGNQYDLQSQMECELHKKTITQCQ